MAQTPSNNSSTTASLAPLPNFRILLFGENGAVSQKLLKKKFFVRAKLFDKLSLLRMAAEEDIKKIIKSFGSEVKMSYLKNTSEYQEFS